MNENEQTLSKIKIEDNFLEQEKFDEIQCIVNPMVDNTNPASPSHNFPWYFRYKYYAKPENDSSYNIGLKCLRHIV